MKLIKYIESVTDKAVAMPTKMVDSLKDNFKTHVLFSSLTEEIKQIHLSHGKKFLLFDKNHTLNVPENSRSGKI